MQWNWTEEKTKRWLVPAIEIPYLSEQWKARGYVHVLDNGCGPGRHAMYFARNGFQVTALDKSVEALAFLKDRCEREELSLELVDGDIFSLPFAENTFDAVLDYNVSYHTDTAGYEKAVAEIRRVLRPGGEVYLTVLSQNDPGFQSAAPEAHADAYTLVHAGGVPHFYASRDSLRELFKGFEPVVPVREIRTAGLDNPKESIHYHLLLRKL